MLSVGVANTKVVCSDVEVLRIQPPDANTCYQYLASYVAPGGYLTNPNSTSDCGLCTVSDTNVFLAQIASSYDTRWRNFGLLWCYIVFNMAAAVLIYWVARVPKKSKNAA